MIFTVAPSFPPLSYCHMILICICIARRHHVGFFELKNNVKSKNAGLPANKTQLLSSRLNTPEWWKVIKFPDHSLTGYSPQWCKEQPRGHYVPPGAGRVKIMLHLNIEVKIKWIVIFKQLKILIIGLISLYAGNLFWKFLFWVFM